MLFSKKLSSEIAHAINDSGAIVGTATHTSTGTGDPIAAGSHGVLLLPATVTSVSFDGTKYWQVESDDGATQYSAPQWADAGNKACSGKKGTGTINDPKSQVTTYTYNDDNTLEKGTGTFSQLQATYY